MVKNIICGLFLVFASFGAKGQRVDALLEKARSLRFSNPDSAELLLKKAIKELEPENDLYRLSRAYNMRGTVEYVRGNVQKSDSLYRIGLKLAERSGNDSVQVFVLNNIGQLYFDYGTYEESEKYYKQALAKASSSKLPFEIGDSYNNLGTLNMTYKRGSEAIAYFRKGIETYKGIASGGAQAEMGMADISCNLGDVYFNEGKYELAIPAFFSALKTFEQQKAWTKAAVAANNITEVYFEKSNYKKASQYARLALSFDKKSPNTYFRANTLFVIGKISYETGLYDSAEACYKRAAALYTEINQLSSIGAIYNSMAALYQKQEKLPLARSFFEKSLELNIESGDTAGMCSNYINLAHLAKKQGNLEQAAEYNSKGLKIISREIGYAHMVELYGQAADIMGAQKRYREAFEYQLLYNGYKDSLRNENLMKQQEELEAVYQNEKKEQQLVLANAELLSSEESSKRKSAQLYAALIGGLLLLVLVGFVVRTNIQRKKNNRLLQEKNALISRQKEKVEGQRKELEEKNTEIEEKNKEILDSINYAQRIQYALLAHDELLRNNLPEHFVLFKPKDIVSGDFYWATEKNWQEAGAEQKRFYLAVCDSTGHGVPGAFMSLLNISFLNEAINEKSILKPNQVLDHVRRKLIENMSEERQDGMDGILLCLWQEEGKMKISYAAAHNAPVVVRNKEIVSPGADKMPVGKGERTEPFTLRELEVQSGDVIYLYTDGYADQFGGPKGKKFKYKQLEALLISIHHLPMKEQSALLDQTIESWKGNLEQVDDVCIAAIRI